jgi:hypothetical protein
VPEAGLYLVRPPGVPVPGKVRVLTDALVERFSDNPDWDSCHKAIVRNAKPVKPSSAE